MLHFDDGKTCVNYSVDEVVDGRPIASDWSISLKNIRKFLNMPNLQTIVVIRDDNPINSWGEIYRKREIGTLTIYDNGRIVGGLYRLDEENFIFQPSYNTPQEVWEYIYPNPCERAHIKLEAQLFPQYDDSRRWYFIGRNSGRLYRLDKDAHIGFAGISVNLPSPELRETGIADGLQAEEYCPNSHYFSSDAIGGTGYDRHKIDSVSKLITTAAMCAGDAIDIIRQALTNTEYEALVAA